MKEFAILLATGLAMSAQIPGASGVQPQELSISIPQGRFVFRSLTWSDPAIRNTPWFSGEIENETPVTWKELRFRFHVHGEDGPRDFEVQIPLGLLAGAKAHISNVTPYPRSAVPITDASAEWMMGTEKTVVDALLYDGLFVKAKDCIPDFISMLSLSGLDLRKKLFELQAYDCVVIARDAYVDESFATHTETFGGSKERRKFTMALLKNSLDGSPLDVGWIPTERIRRGTRVEIIDRAKESRHK